MCGGAIEVKIIFLDVFAVITLAVGQPKQPLLEDRVLAVPQRDRKAQKLPVVTVTSQPILAPVVGARPCLVVGKIVPGVAILAIVFAHRSPLTFTNLTAS